MVPRLPDIDTLLATQMMQCDKKAKDQGLKLTESLFVSVLAQLRIMDEQDAINRFKWYGLYDGLDAHLMERIMYYRYQGAGFFMEPLNNKFFFLPYALNSQNSKNRGIDVYGRYEAIKPLPFNGTSALEGDDKKVWIPGLTKNCFYDVQLPEEVTEETFLDGCVLLSDYSKQISQNGLPRASLSEQILQAMARCICYMMTALKNSTGIEGMIVEDEDDEDNVFAASVAVDQAAISGLKWVAMIGKPTFSQLTNGPVAKVEEYLLCLQSLDNYRLSLHGLDNGGLFLKKSHLLEAEQAQQSGKKSAVIMDGWENRLKWCDIMNSIFGGSAYCEINEDPFGTMQPIMNEMPQEEQADNEGGDDDVQ